MEVRKIVGDEVGVRLVLAGLSIVPNYSFAVSATKFEREAEDCQYMTTERKGL